MSPADMRKEDSAYDLTLAIGVLAASGQIKAPHLERFIIIGELSLDGSLNPIERYLLQSKRWRKVLRDSYSQNKTPKRQQL